MVVRAILTEMFSEKPKRLYEGLVERIKSEIQIVRKKDLPTVDVDWLILKDHFVATVGPTSGQGRPFGNLLVLADAIIKPMSSFPMHPHKDMEILTWVVSGTLQHKDDIGTSAKISSQTVQFMSARDGIYHAEGNQGATQIRLLQIWIRPNLNGGEPIFGIAKLDKPGFNLLASPDGALAPRQDVWLHVAILNSETQEIEIPEGKIGYAVVIDKLALNGTQLQDGDGVVLAKGFAEFAGTGQAIVIIQNDFEKSTLESRRGSMVS